MASARKASGRVPPPPLRVPPATPPPRSASRRTTSRPAPITPTSPGPRTPSTPSRWSPESYDLNRLFECSPTPTPPRYKSKSGTPKAGPTLKAGVLTGYTKVEGIRKNAKSKSKPKVTVYADDKTLGLVKGRRLLEEDLDKPLCSTDLESGSPRYPRSPTYSSGRASAEGKLLRRSKSFARMQFSGGREESLDLE